MFKNGDTINTSSGYCTDSYWKSNPLPVHININKVEMLIQKNNSLLMGIRMYNKSGGVIFTTGNLIEDNDYRNDTDF